MEAKLKSPARGDFSILAYLLESEEFVDLCFVETDHD